MYSTGTYEFVRLDEPNAIVFRFSGNTNWRVEISEKPFFAIPFVGDPKGVSRKFGFNRYLKVFGNPVPQSA